MSPQPSGRTLFFFEKPSAMRQLQRFFRSPNTVSVAAEGHLLTAEEPGSIRPEWKPWRFEALPIVLDTIPVAAGQNRSGQSHAPKLAAIRQALQDVERVIIATDPGREGSMIAWEVLEHLGWSGRVDRLKLGALDDVSIRRAFASLARETKSGDQDYAAYLEALCRQYEDYHLGLNGTRAISLRLRPPAFRDPWRFGGVQTPTLAILADLEERIRSFVPHDFFKVALHLRVPSGAALTLWHAPKERILDPAVAETIREAAAGWSGPLAVEQKDVRRSPPRLFSKDTLARRCAKRFGWDPQHTAGLAQELYDQGYLSYPRTESEYLPEGQIGDARRSSRLLPKCCLSCGHSSRPTLSPCCGAAPRATTSRIQVSITPSCRCAKCPSAAAFQPISSDFGSSSPKRTSPRTSPTASTHAPLSQRRSLRR